MISCRVFASRGVVSRPCLDLLCGRVLPWCAVCSRVAMLPCMAFCDCAIGASCISDVVCAVECVVIVVSSVLVVV